jgi:hypothetical protein
MRGMTLVPMRKAIHWVQNPNFGESYRLADHERDSMVGTGTNGCVLSEPTEVPHGSVFPAIEQSPLRADGLGGQTDEAFRVVE